ncbi:fasciclin domain-containing protein [Actinomarinicola tropica]|uniref:FAS1 domain-containing protein n=1 Tax=Actinomarinicola tropica TaxID=2789776 RepID=A0A5Q2RP23_9ACTN|nr:fasciclin domain-containing protein [Actinomarinicola tropica]QGG96341.1 hypothetical protein GH723_15235 [Actinomarinicola tropica]
MSRRRLARLITPVLALAVATAACSSDPGEIVVSGVDPVTAPKDLVETLEAEGFTVLAALVDEAGLNEALSDDGETTYTIFAPSDAAFGELAPGLAELLSGEDDVVAEPPRSTEQGEVNTGQETGVEGEAADAEVDPEATADDGAADGDAATGGDDEADTAAEEGQLPPGDDEQLAGEDPLPSDDDAEDQEGTDAEAETAVPPAPTQVGPRPSRAEIQQLLADILSYHVVEGTYLAADLEGQGSLTSLEGSDLELGSREEEPANEGDEPTTVPTVDGADISATDLRATNGVVHTIDSLLIPEDRQEALDALVASIPVTTDVVSTLQSTGDHGELIAAVQQAGLAQDLVDAGALTLFAPTDAAFQALSPEQRAALSDPEVLASVLGFHGVPQTITTADVANREQVSTLEGQDILIVKDGDTYTVEDVTIDESIVTTNGVVHVIGEILVPDSAMGPGGL